MNLNKCRLESIELKLINPGERARKEYRNIDTLANDIKTRGLIHPIAVKEDGDGFLLLAGGRRLAASQLLASPTVDCKVYPEDLTELEVKSIELMENVQREDLTYYEEANLEREILALQESIHGKKISTSPDAPGVSKTDVAEMIGVSREKLRQDVDLAKTMEQFPDIDWKKLKNRSEAMKMKDNISNIVIRQEAVKRFDKEVGTGKQDRYLKKLGDSFIHGDFFEIAKQIPDGTINLVEIDPPYAIKLDKVKKRKGIGNFTYSEEGYNEIAPDDYIEFLSKTFAECYRVMANDSFLLCWFGPEPWFQIVLDLLRQAKFNVRGMPCMWVKGKETDEGMVDKTSGQTMSPMRHLANSYEMFFYAKKGDPKIARQGHTNIFGHKPVSPKQKIHPTERPVELMKDVLTTFAKEGAQVLVPFLGSGNTLIASYESKMTAFGTDLGIEHKEAYITRLTHMLK